MRSSTRSSTASSRSSRSSGERLDDLELEVATSARRGCREQIHEIKRELLTLRRAIWPQRDLINALLRDESPHITKETRVYLRDTYDHAVQVMDMVETFREIASGLMDLYLSGVSNRMNEIMKVLTIISTIFLPVTFIAGVYGMNFDPDVVAVQHARAQLALRLSVCVGAHDLQHRRASLLLPTKGLDRHRAPGEKAQAVKRSALRDVGPVDAPRKARDSNPEAPS